MARARRRTASAAAAQSSPDKAFTQTLSFYAPTTAEQAMTACASAGGSFAAN
jgi:hypothetical protein